MKTQTSIGTYGLMAGTLALAAAFGCAQANAETSFAGRRINVIVSSPPGGGTDGTTRLVARYMEKYLPGHPRHLVRNMPGGHGSKALSFFAHEVKPDGLTWTGSSSAQLDANNLRKKVFNYDPRKFEYIGGINRGGSVVLMRKSVADNLHDKSKKPAVIGTIDGSRTWAQLLLWGVDELGWNARFVVGYPGTPSLILAARRGEVDVVSTGNIELLNSLLKTGDFVGLSQYGQMESGTIVPRSSFPKIPLISDQLKKVKLSPIAQATFKYWVATLQYDKWYALPPKTPKDIVATYQAVWAKVSKDQKFLKEGQLQFSTDFRPMTGDDMQEIVDNTSYPKKEYLDYMVQMRVKYGLPAQGLNAAERKRLAAKFAAKALKVSTSLKEVNNGGRELVFEVKGGQTHKVKISGHRTKVSIGGKATKRKNLKPGMKCDITYPGNGMEAKAVACM